MDFSIFLTNNLGKIVFTIGILLTAFVIRIVVKKTLRAAFTKFKGKLNSDRLARTNTLRLLIVNIINSVAIFIAILTVLSTWGVNVAPILTGIGIFGIAISFGSQSLVKDLISGFFIILEDQYNVGDKIKIGTNEGVVKKITIRLTVLRDKAGNKIYIPNSKIDVVTKFKRKKSHLKNR